jgi:hypothetical protein
VGEVQNRIAAAGAAGLAIAALSACSSTQSPAQIASTASVTVNGTDARMPIVRCSQLEWFRTIDIGGDVSGATVVIDQHAQPITATSVRIQNLGGFTGMYSLQDDGAANASFSGDTFTITGSAHGFKTDKPGEPAAADFKIIAKC